MPKFIYEINPWLFQKWEVVPEKNRCLYIQLSQKKTHLNGSVKAQCKKDYFTENGVIYCCHVYGCVKPHSEASFGVIFSDDCR